MGYKRIKNNAGIIARIINHSTVIYVYTCSLAIYDGYIIMYYYIVKVQKAHFQSVNVRHRNKPSLGREKWNKPPDPLATRSHWFLSIHGWMQMRILSQFVRGSHGTCIDCGKLPGVQVTAELGFLLYSVHLGDCEYCDSLHALTGLAFFESPCMLE